MSVKLRAGLVLLSAALVASAAAAVPQGKSKKPTGQTTGDKVREVLPEGSGCSPPRKSRW